MKTVSVIIPNYNGIDLMKKHLPAVFKMLRAGDEVIIIDDASSDGSVDWLKEEYRLAERSTESSDYCLYFHQRNLKDKSIDVTVVQNLQNLRFAANCNRGVSLSKKDLVFLLNTDVTPHPDALKYLVPHFENEQVFGVGCSETEMIDGKEVNGGKNILFFQRGMFAHNRAPNMKTGETAWISGGSGLFDRSKWNILKGFDVAFAPAYWEDVDLSFRAKERGWLILFESQAKVDHNHESTNSSAFGQKKITEMSWRNANYFTIKNGTWLQKIQYLLWQPYWFLKMKEVQ